MNLTEIATQARELARELHKYEPLTTVQPSAWLTNPPADMGFFFEVYESETTKLKDTP